LLGRLIQPSSLDSLKKVLSVSHRTKRIRLLRTFPIFKRFISIQNIRANIYSSAFLPVFFFDFETALFIVLLHGHVSSWQRSFAVINKKFLEKSLQYRDNAVSFYTDDSKIDKDRSSGMWEFSPQI